MNKITIDLDAMGIDALEGVTICSDGMTVHGTRKLKNGCRAAVTVKVDVSKDNEYFTLQQDEK